MDSLTDHCYLESNEHYGQAVLQKKNHPFFFHKFVTKHCPILKNIAQRAAFRNQIVISHFPIRNPNKSCSNKPNEAPNAYVSTGSSLKVGASPTEPNSFLVNLFLITQEKEAKRAKPNGRKK